MLKLFENENLVFYVLSQKPEYDFYRVHQVHGNNLVNFQDLSNPHELTKADGIFWTQKPDRPISIITADCLPLLYTGKNGGALVHAGWRGLHQNIHLNPELNQISPTHCYVGPHIHMQDYQVGKEFVDHFGKGEWLKQIKQQWYFSQLEYLTHTLSNHFKGIKIESSAINTYDDQQLYSHRRAAGAGRNWNTVVFK